MWVRHFSEYKLSLNEQFVLHGTWCCENFGFATLPRLALSFLIVPLVEPQTDFWLRHSMPTLLSCATKSVARVASTISSHLVTVMTVRTRIDCALSVLLVLIPASCALVEIHFKGSLVMTSNFHLCLSMLDHHHKLRTKSLESRVDGINLVINMLCGL